MKVLAFVERSFSEQREILDFSDGISLSGDRNSCAAASCFVAIPFVVGFVLIKDDVAVVVVVVVVAFRSPNRAAMAFTRGRTGVAVFVTVAFRAASLELISVAPLSTCRFAGYLARRRDRRVHRDRRPRKATLFAFVVLAFSSAAFFAQIANALPMSSVLLALRCLSMIGASEPCWRMMR